MSDNPSSRVYYIKKEEVDNILQEIEGSQFRAEHLVREFYVGNMQFSRPVLIYLLELVVTADGFLIFLDEIFEEGGIYQKDDVSTYRVTEKNLKLMANFSVMNKNIKVDLRELGLDVDLQ